MVNAIKKRVEKSREKNPLWTGKIQSDRPLGNKRKHTDDKPANNKRRNTDNRPNNKDQRRVKHLRVENGAGEDNVQPYSGMTSKPGENKMRSRFNLKSQAALHKETVKKESKNKKFKAKLQLQKKEERNSRKEIRVSFQMLRHIFESRSFH